MKKTLALILPALLLTSVAEATPTLYPTDPNRVHLVTNSTKSDLIADDADVNLVWVLPPNVAVASAGNPHTPTANIGFCREMGNLQDYSRTTAEYISQLSEQRLANKERTDKLLADLGKARESAAAFATEHRLQPLVDLDSRIKDLEDRLSVLYKEAQTCRTTCREIDTELRTVESEKRGLLQDRRRLANENTVDVRAYEKKTALVAALEKNYSEAVSSFNQISSDLGKIRADFLEMYSTFGRMEGIRVSFTYKSEWDENVMTLRQENPNFRFEKVVTQKAKLFASAASVNNLPGDGAILDYGMPGLKKDNYVELESGFPESIESNAVLSLVGACPIMHPEYFDIKPGYGADKMAYGLTITYEFPSAMKLSATAKYNMYKMYQKIIESKSRGGLFSSRTRTSVEERTEFKDSFNVDWKTQDPANSVTEERRLEIESEMRANIMQRMASLALPAAPDRAGIIAANPLPARGGVVIASSLMKTCPGNKYCLAGAAILTGLDAIFGSGKSTASYMQTQNFEVTESWSNSTVVMKPWVTSFISEQN